MAEGQGPEVTGKLTQFCRAVERATADGATELGVSRLEVGAGRPDWMLARYVSGEGEQIAWRIAPSGEGERVNPTAPAEGPPAGITDADRDLANERAAEADWERSAREQERR